MCKANDSIITKVSDLMELRKMIEDLQTEAEALTDEIKAYMGEEETMMAGTWKVTYKSTVSRRISGSAPSFSASSSIVSATTGYS